MRPITVAVVDMNQNQSVPLDKLVRQDDPSITILVDVKSSYDATVERRLKSRKNVTVLDDAIAKVKRLQPRILLVNVSEAEEAFCDLLTAIRHQCPHTQPVVIMNKPVKEDFMLRTLASGARGFIKSDLDSKGFSKVVNAINRGEAWVSRKIIGKIMQQIVFESQKHTIEADFDSSS